MSERHTIRTVPPEDYPLEEHLWTLQYYCSPVDDFTPRPIPGSTPPILSLTPAEQHKQVLDLLARAHQSDTVRQGLCSAAKRLLN